MFKILLCLKVNNETVSRLTETVWFRLFNVDGFKSKQFQIFHSKKRHTKGKVSYITRSKNISARGVKLQA